MNKQEALEALLVKMRGWEAPDQEVRATSPSVVADAMHRNVMRLLDMREAEVAGAKVPGEDFGAALICIGAAALYLLVDEVTVVEGRSLDEWLADKPGIANPTPINGAIGVRFGGPGA